MRRIALLLSLSLACLGPLACGTRECPATLNCVLDTRGVDSDGGVRDGGYCVWHPPVCCAEGQPLCGIYTEDAGVYVHLALSDAGTDDCLHIAATAGCR